MSEDVKSELIKFVTGYTELLNRQLNDVHKEMEQAVSAIMDGISKISDETDLQTKKADTVLVGETSKDEADGRKLADEEKDRIRKLGPNGKVNPSAEIVQIGNKLKTYMSGLKGLDSSVQEAVFAMMGKMSNDDVIRQQVEHIAFSSSELAKTLADLYQDLDTQLIPSKIKKIEDELLNRIMSSYTMESEKELFKKVFNG